MNFDLLFVLLALVIYLAFTTAATTGFGSVLICLALGSFLIPIPELLPIVVPLNLGMSLWLVSVHWRQVAWGFLLRVLLPPMLVGLAGGFLAAHLLPPAIIRPLFALAICWLAAMEITVLLRNRLGDQNRQLPPLVIVVLLFAGGVLHGMYASGGPLVVYVIARMEWDKSRLRGTLLCLWTLLNGLLTAGYLLQGRIGSGELLHMAWLAPVVILAMLTGEWLHRRIPLKPFRFVVFSLLLVTAIPPLFQAIG